MTPVHRRLWPAVVRVADRFPPEHLAALHEEHSASGAHRVHEQAFQSVDDALALFPACIR